MSKHAWTMRHDSLWSLGGKFRFHILLNSPSRKKLIHLPGTNDQNKFTYKIYSNEFDSVHFIQIPGALKEKYTFINPF